MRAEQLRKTSFQFSALVLIAVTTEFSGRKFAWQAARRGAIFLVLMFGVPAFIVRRGKD
jgi:hypothetical protein